MAPAQNRFIEGAKVIAPLMLGAVPFGLIVGVTAAGSAIDNWAGWASSVIVFAGAAQLALFELLDAGSLAAVAIATPLVINLRHLMYSAALAPQFSKLAAADRVWLPYFLTDQTFVIAMGRFRPDEDPITVKWFYLGASVTLWTAWVVATTLGVLVGAEVPPEWSLDFAIPLVFLALLVPSISSRPALLAAVVGGVVAVVARDLAQGTGIIVATLAGVIAGTIADWRSTR